MRLVDSSGRYADAIASSRIAPDFDTIRKHGQELLKASAEKGYIAEAAPVAPAEKKADEQPAKPDPARPAAPTSQLEQALAAPHVLVEEVQEEAAGTRRLRVTFAS